LSKYYSETEDDPQLVGITVDFILYVYICVYIAVALAHPPGTAVHSDNSTPVNIIAFENKRGIPVTIRSNMGTNFVGADNELKKIKYLFDRDNIKSDMANKAIDWHFNCPSNQANAASECNA